MEKEYKTKVTFVLCAGKCGSSAIAMLSNCRSVMAMHDEETLCSCTTLGGYNFIDWGIKRALALDQHLLLCSTLSMPTLRSLIGDDPNYLENLVMGFKENEGVDIQINLVYLSAAPGLAYESYCKVGLDFPEESLNAIQDECYELFRDTACNGQKLQLVVRTAAGYPNGKLLLDFAHLIGLDEYNASRFVNLMPYYHIGMTKEALLSVNKRVKKAAEESERMLKEIEEQLKDNGNA